MRIAFATALLLWTAGSTCIAVTNEVSNYDELSRACRAARAGDTILLNAGTYRIKGASRIFIEHRPGPVIVRGATGKASDVIVEGAGQDDESVQMIFDLDDCPGWVFEDFTTRNSYYHGFKFNGNSTNCVLRRIVMRDHGESGVKGTSNPKLGVYPDYLLIENCDIGFTTTNGGTRSVVEGIDGVGVNGWVIRRNRFVNVVQRGGVACAVFTKGNSSGTIIEQNRFEDCCIGASFGGGGTGPPYFRDNNREVEHRGGVIRNNVFIRCTDAAVYLNKARDAQVLHNTIFECVLTIQLRYPETSASVWNNLMKLAPSNPDEPLVRLRDGARLSEPEPMKPQMLYGNRTAKDSDFVRATGRSSELDLHLTRRASAMDAAMGKPYVANDFDGNQRPIGARADVGAFESRQ